MITNPAHQSINQLAALTGKAAQTVRKRLIGLEPVEKRGAAIIYDTRQALPLIYEAGVGLADANNYEVEKARSEKNRADKLEMENAKTRGDFIDRADVIAALQKSFAAVRAKLLAIPTKAAPVVITLGDIPLAQRALKKFIHDALDELAYDGVEVDSDD